MVDEKEGFSEQAAHFVEREPRPSATLKVRKIGNSLGVVLPKEMLAGLKAGEGDELLVTETANGVQLSRKDSEFEEHMRLVEKVMARYPNTLRALAK